VARAVIEGLGEPVAAPSANRYQGLSPTTAAHVVKQLGDAVDLVLDAGECEAGIESTVVDVRGAVARVLRPGAVDVVSLRALVPGLEAHAERVEPGQPHASPGLAARHYAPRSPLWLASTREEAERLAFGVAAQGKRVGVVIRGSGIRKTVSSVLLVRELPSNAAQYARALYRTLHELDDAGVDAIVVQAVPSDDTWAAVADRLHRAAERS
jgi:L-threonylcarbamoyladenylate synthase